MWNMGISWILWTKKMQNNFSFSEVDSIEQHNPQSFIHLLTLFPPFAYTAMKMMTDRPPPSRLINIPVAKQKEDKEKQKLILFV